LGVHKFNKKSKLVWLTENGQKPSNTVKFFPPEIENVDNWSNFQKSQMPELVSIKIVGYPNTVDWQIRLSDERYINLPIYNSSSGT
jgi:hypothetical protein